MSNPVNQSGWVDMSEVTDFVWIGLPEYEDSEVARLSRVSLAESETVVATLGSPADRAEVERLKAVAAALLTGTPAGSPEAHGEGSDADEVKRLAKIAKENR